MDAITISKNIIKKMYEIDQEITQLKLQKLLYFTEAYYMAVYDKDELFQEDFYAWTYGPVCKEVYDEFKVYMDLPIPESVCNNLGNLDKDIIESIDIVCDVFGKLKETDLIQLTHMKDSPWSKLSSVNNEIPIPKSETKNWFNELFLKNEK